MKRDAIELEGTTPEEVFGGNPKNGAYMRQHSREEDERGATPGNGWPVRSSKKSQKKTAKPRNMFTE